MTTTANPVLQFVPDETVANTELATFGTEVSFEMDAPVEAEEQLDEDFKKSLHDAFDAWKLRAEAKGVKITNVQWYV